MNEREKNPNYQHVKPEELKLPTSKLIELLDAALEGQTSRGKTVRQEYYTEPEGRRIKAEQEARYAPIKERAEQERRIKEIQDACLSMIDSALALLQAKHTHRAEFKIPGSESGQNKEGYVRVIKVTGGDFPWVRFIFDTQGIPYDIILAKDPKKGVVYDQYLLDEKKWRRAPLHEGEQTADTKFYGDDLLQLEQELSAVAEALELVEDFSQPIMPAHE